MTITIGLTDTQKQQILADAEQQRQAIVNAAQPGAIADDQFTYFAAFDGTNNDLGQLPNTNVAQLWERYSESPEFNSRLNGKYFPGPGTREALTASSWLSPVVTQQVINTAEDAYKDFALKATAWVRANPSASVCVALTSFSRGDASAAIFTQLLYERGLVDAADRTTILIPPGQVKVLAGVLFDPVTTGVSVNLAFAPNVSNVVDIFAANEYRQVFKAADYSAQPGVTTISMFGNHSDIGGQYDASENAIGVTTLQAATQFFRNSGIPIGDPLRTFDPNQLAIHDEGYTPNGAEVWTEYAKFDPLNMYADVRLRDQVATVATVTTSDGSTVETLDLFNGNTITITTPAGAHSVNVKETLRNAQGLQTTEVRNFDGSAYPTSLADSVVTRGNADSVQKSVDAWVYKNDDSVAIEVPSASSALVTIGAVNGVRFSVALTGGSGFDTYRTGETQSQLTIQDSDGLGRIVDGNAQLVLGVKVSDGVWALGGTTFTRSPDGNDLVATFDGNANGAVTIKGYDFARAEGYLGIRLIDSVSLPTNAVRTFYGDKQDWDSDPVADGTQTVDDGFGNAVRADGQGGRPDLAQANRADGFYGSAAGEVEYFQTAGGNDSVWADGPDSIASTNGGNDFVDASSGQDVVAAGGGDDWVEGGADDDILGGNAGNDVIYADTSNNHTLTLDQVISAGAAADTIVGHGDLLSGDSGDDLLYGANTSDVLLGGLGQDVIVGGG